MLKIGMLQLHPSPQEADLLNLYAMRWWHNGGDVRCLNMQVLRHHPLENNNNLLPPQNSCSIAVRVIRQQFSLCVPQVLLSGLSIYVAICLAEKRARG